ncbi:MAG: VOC family protein [Candidatus Thermoplasmatota archaeon]|nr:VOC family protein [Candidatus Thermoplasmatota archaeon]
MVEPVVLQHVAVECDDQVSADRFFTEICGLSKTKSTVLSTELSQQIFGLTQSVTFCLYENGQMRVEVFIHHGQRPPSYAHLCIEVEDKQRFMDRCRQQGLQPFVVMKESKELLFVRDVSGNLFEIKLKK